MCVHVGVCARVLRGVGCKLSSHPHEAGRRLKFRLKDYHEKTQEDSEVCEFSAKPHMQVHRRKYIWTLSPFLATTRLMFWGNFCCLTGKKSKTDPSRDRQNTNYIWHKGLKSFCRKGEMRSIPHALRIHFQEKIYSKLNWGKMIPHWEKKLLIWWGVKKEVSLRWQFALERRGFRAG